MATADLTVLALGRPDASAGEYIAELKRRLGAQERRISSPSTPSTPSGGTASANCGRRPNHEIDTWMDLEET